MYTWIKNSNGSYSMKSPEGVFALITKVSKGWECLPSSGLAMTHKTLKSAKSQAHGSLSTRTAHRG